MATPLTTGPVTTGEANAPPPSSPAPSPMATFLDANDCASRYQVSPAHWRRLVDAGRAPQPVRLGRLVRWAVRTLDEWEAIGCPTVRNVRGGGR